MTTGSIRPLNVVVQDRSRLYRESLELLLAGEMGLSVIGVTDSLENLVPLLAADACHGVVIEATPGKEALADALHDVRSVAPDSRIVVTYVERVGLGWTDEDVRFVSRSGPTADIAAALRGHPPGARRPDGTQRSATLPMKLTRRELHVLALLAESLTTAEMAERLEISPKTVENHRHSLYSKLDVQNQSGAVAAALRSGLLTGPRPIGTVS